MQAACGYVVKRMRAPPKAIEVARGRVSATEGRSRQAPAWNRDQGAATSSVASASHAGNGSSNSIQ